MNSSDKKTRSSKRNFCIALSLLLITNIVMGMTLTFIYKKTLREQIDQRMLDIANTAASQLNGDELKELKAEDEGSESYERALDTLRAFQDNIQLDYIYGIRAEDDGTFTFTIDPAVEDPGEFGSPIETTDALRQAAKGRPSVDKESYEDAWGRFYSAYSPVFDSDGEIAGIVGVDFNAEWYDGKLNSNIAVVVIITATTMLMGIVLSAIILSQNRREFAGLMKSLEKLDSEMNKLDVTLVELHAKKLDMLPQNEVQLLKTLAAGEAMKQPVREDYDALYTGIDAVYNKFERYVKYMESKTYTDETTGVCNKIAYKQKISALDEAISAGEASFSVAFFDVNNIKRIYTKYGFDAGEALMYKCASLLKKVYDKECVYHVTGDEFIVIIEHDDDFDMTGYFTRFDEAVEHYNAGAEEDKKLSVAKGQVRFSPKEFNDYRQVFSAAKAACDADKAEYYKNLNK